MDPTEPPPLFPGQDRRPSKSPPRNPPLAGCAAGSSSPSPSQSARVDALRSPAAPSPELLEDTLMTVLGTLEIPDLVRAGAVCTSWRSAYVTRRNLGQYKQSQTPCLLYTTESDGDNVACLYSLVEKRVYRLNLPEPPIRSRYIIGSSLGFLVTVDEQPEMHLVNPITGEQIALPSATEFGQVRPMHDDAGAVHSYEYPSYSGEIIAPASLRDYFHHKAFVFSDASTGRYIVVLIHGPSSNLSFVRLGSYLYRWTSLFPKPCPEYQDCTFNNGLLYAVTILGEVHAWELGAYTKTKGNVRGIEKNLCVNTMNIVQAPWGGLLLVSRSKEFEDTDDEDAEPEITTLNTTKIKLHKVDGIKWLLNIDCLPDHVLFLGLNSTLCLSAKEHPALKGNHAYFTDDEQYNSERKSSRRDIGVFDLGNNSKEDLVSPQLWSNWPAPVWITLNLKRMQQALPK